MTRRAREFDGCIHFAIDADALDPHRINSVEIWRDAAALQAWRDQADAPSVEKIESMDVRRYEAVDGGPLF